MSTKLRLPTLALAALSICLSIAILGCAGRTLQLFNTQQASNPWLLPVWPNHFDTKGLQALIGASAVTLLLNAVLALALFVQALPANIIVLVCALCGVAMALLAIVFPAVVNNKAPTMDTVQTWTCRWSDAEVNRGKGPPDQFITMCNETRFAFYASVPLLVIQLLLLGLACRAVVARKSTRSHLDAEKGHELGEVRQGSWDAKGGSPTSITADSARILGDKQWHSADE